MYAAPLRKSYHMDTYTLKVAAVAGKTGKNPAMMRIARIKLPATTMELRVAAVAAANLLQVPSRVQSGPHLSMPEISF